MSNRPNMTEEEAWALLERQIDSLKTYLKEQGALKVLEHASDRDGYSESAVLPLNDRESLVFNFAIGARRRDE